MLNFDFLGKGLEIVSPQHFLNDFSRKCLSCYILQTEQILLLEILDSMRIEIVNQFVTS